ncbi:universal stress protein [Streptomyces sp. CMB-StM0423]|uniref:universal stress protein n=1 Tax=Streptomyces sp. CMB-StM0423 TaxID=2059884 RepID=UPI000C705C75|nr:universal stress protein [Streptomyces sp. CMB-StM0423]AUH38877.1 stress-inducible protein [Streptomyces sp. CMB-StM0423]
MSAERVVVGFDGSLPAVRALDLAAEEAVLRRAELEIVYALPDTDAAAPVLTAAQDRVRARHPELPTSALPEAGDPARALLRRGRSAALTVVGCREHGGVAGLLTGSVSRRVIARAHGPVLVARGGRRGRRPAQGGGFVLLIAGGGDVDAAVFAFAEAQRRGVELRVRHARMHTPPPALNTTPPRHTAPTPAHPPPPSDTPRPPRARPAPPAGAPPPPDTGEALLVVAACRPSRGRHTAARAVLQPADCPIVLVPAH